LQYRADVNTGSNGVCRSAGFRLFGECEIEYPPGTMMPANDWRYDLGDRQ